jgi:hypothetical protein
LGLPIEREILLPLPPGAHTMWPQEDSDGMARMQNRFQGLGPRSTRHQVPAIQEHGQPVLPQLARDGLHRSVIPPVITEKNVMLGHQISAPAHFQCRGDL